jgi:uncharacterized membrane protein YkgB
MSQIPSVQDNSAGTQVLPFNSTQNSEGPLLKVAAWIESHNLPFFVTSVGMIVMLLWAGLFKMTSIGAEGIIPLVDHSPLISWHFRLFGPYIGSDMIGLTEITAALLFIVGYFKAQAGIAGGLITTLMFFITSTMVATTPGAIITFHGMRYMSFMGLFLFKDVIAFGASLALIAWFWKRANRENAGIDR